MTSPLAAAEVGAADRALSPRFIGSEIYRSSSYGGRHPLAIPRVSTCIDLCRTLGWLPDHAYIDSPLATPEQLARFHSRAYIAAVQKAEREQRLSEDEQQRFNLGRNGNPIYPEIFRRPATACGASILAGQMLAKDGIIHSPAGGTHHGRPDQASGFCYFNDPVLGILALLDGGIARIAYLDIDAHHGDGVQAAFHGDPRVLTISIHEAMRWPMVQGGAGGVDDRAAGLACNLPVPAGFNDSELAFLMETVVLPLIDDFAPQALVLQCGADGLEEDPLSKLSLSNLALWRTVALVRDLTPRLLVLGGGGYNPWSVGRAWAGVWATLNRFEIPDRLSGDAEAVLRGLEWRHSRGRNPPEDWFTTLADRPRNGPLRKELRELAARATNIKLR